MENTENSVISENVASNVAPVESTEVKVKGKQGRPKLPVTYPSEPFTVDSLASMNTLSAGNLRMKIKEDQSKGILIALDEKQSNGGALGRKRTMYKFVPKSVETVENVQI